MKATLALEDGRVFHGESFGASSECTGEVCFNTSMTGYQEVLTDPSYRGQLVAMTYPMIGNYGINEEDNESDQPHVRAFIIEELCEIPSNWRSSESLDSYLKRHNVAGISGIDTRALTRHLREKGAMKAALIPHLEGELSDKEAVQKAVAGDGVVGMDYVQEVSTPTNYLWDEENKKSRNWSIPNPSSQIPLEAEGINHYEALPPVEHNIIAYDFGIKRNMLRRLRQNGFATKVVNCQTSAQEILAEQPDGVFLSNGPGDPAALEYIHQEIAQLLGKVPIFAICLGHQLLAHAFGGKTFKLQFGHRGGNQPVKDLRNDKISITSQNHGFAVDAESLPPEIEVTHLNLNDNTVEGMRHRDYPVFSVQYHPEAAPGPNDAAYFFEEFSQLIKSNHQVLNHS